jgi:hypothetical protein
MGNISLVLRKTIIAKALFSLYCKEIKGHIKFNEAIFLATNLKKKYYNHNYLVEALESVFPKIVTTPAEVMMVAWGEYYGRETSALTEMMICEDSDYFIGLETSTFSNMILRRMNRKGKGKHGLIITKQSLKSMIRKYKHSKKMVACLNTAVLNSTKKFSNKDFTAFASCQDL